MPLLDEFCRHSLQFVSYYLSDEPGIIRNIFIYAFEFGKQTSCIGRNISFCREWIGISSNKLLNYSKATRAINRYIHDLAKEEQLNMVSFLQQLL